MANENRSNQGVEVSAETAHTENHPFEQMENCDIGEWVNSDEPVVKFLLDMKWVKNAPMDPSSRKTIQEHERLLEEAMLRVTMKMAVDGEDDSAMLAEELEYLTEMRFKTRSSFLEGVPAFVYKVATDAYKAGVEAGAAPKGRMRRIADAIGRIITAMHGPKTREEDELDMLHTKAN